MAQLLKPTPDWEEHEKPTLPGSASMPYHTPAVRLAYAAVALLVGITGGLGNALVSANLPAIGGQLGLTPSEATWLPAAYVMVNITVNLVVFKFRQQYGLRLFTEIGLALYAAVTLLHLMVGGFTMAVAVRAVSGFAGAAATTLSMLYMLQAMPRAYTGKMVVVGVGIPQLATPLAWLLSPTLLVYGQWHNLYLFEAGLALCSLAAVVVLKLPPGMHIKVFEKLDFLTFALMAPGAAMLVALLAQGYAHWWFDEVWLAYLAIGALVLLSAALYIEHHRENPLIQTRWLATPTMLRFIVGAFLIRFLTTEQTVGAVGLLRVLGMGPDQMQPLFAVILAGTVCGIAASSLTFSPKTLIPQIIVAIVLFGAAAALDYGRTSLDRPQDFYFSQFLVALGSGMFLGPLVLLGITQALKFGPNYVITFTVVLSMTQTLGALTGSALLSTYQLHREQVYSTELVSQLNPADPQVARRLQLQAGIYGGTVADPALRAAQGTALLAQIARREANVRAFNDVFALSGVLALLFLFWSLFVAVRAAIRNRRLDAAASNPASPNATT
ncbi:MFS transporter [Massilia sp. Leaf139]|uniref:MFS transporter n=1 Tax=Massilia sp. Leaf139 TaxID=1736272 RepID=UPI0006F3038D|nr:MFS transporter [Massilia sp. Leaf139]KQQ97331.1 MFS transporter [Massilia sp. Leaf139]